MNVEMQLLRLNNSLPVETMYSSNSEKGLLNVSLETVESTTCLDAAFNIISEKESLRNLNPSLSVGPVVGINFMA